MGEKDNLEGASGQQGLNMISRTAKVMGKQSTEPQQRWRAYEAQEEEAQEAGGANELSDPMSRHGPDGSSVGKVTKFKPQTMNSS